MRKGYVFVYLLVVLIVVVGLMFEFYVINPEKWVFGLDFKEFANRDFLNSRLRPPSALERTALDRYIPHSPTPPESTESTGSLSSQPVETKPVRILSWQLMEYLERSIPPSGAEGVSDLYYNMLAFVEAYAFNDPSLLYLHFPKMDLQKALLNVGPFTRKRFTRKDLEDFVEEAWKDLVCTKQGWPSYNEEKFNNLKPEDRESLNSEKNELWARYGPVLDQLMALAEGSDKGAREPVMPGPEGRPESFARVIGRMSEENLLSLKSDYQYERIPLNAEVITYGAGFISGNAANIYKLLRYMKRRLNERYISLFDIETVLMIQALLLGDEDAKLEWSMEFGGEEIINKLEDEGYDPEEVALWLLQNYKFYHIDRGRRLYIPNIPANEEGYPLISIEQLSALQEELEGIQRSMQENPRYLENNRHRVARLFAKADSLLHPRFDQTRSDQSLNRLIDGVDITPNNEEKVLELIRDAGVPEPRPGEDDRWQEILLHGGWEVREVLRHSGIEYNFSISHRRCERLLGSLGIKGLVVTAPTPINIDDGRILGASYIDNLRYLELEGKEVYDKNIISERGRQEGQGIYKIPRGLLTENPGGITVKLGRGRRLLLRLKEDNLLGSIILEGKRLCFIAMGTYDKHMGGQKVEEFDTEFLLKKGGTSLVGLSRRGDKNVFTVVVFHSSDVEGKGYVLARYPAPVYIVSEAGGVERGRWRIDQAMIREEPRLSKNVVENYINNIQLVITHTPEEVTVEDKSVGDEDLVFEEGYIPGSKHVLAIVAGLSEELGIPLKPPPQPAPLLDLPKERSDI